MMLSHQKRTCVLKGKYFFLYGQFPSVSTPVRPLHFPKYFRDTSHRDEQHLHEISVWTRSKGVPQVQSLLPLSVGLEDPALSVCGSRRHAWNVTHASKSPSSPASFSNPTFDCGPFWLAFIGTLGFSSAYALIPPYYLKVRSCFCF